MTVTAPEMVGISRRRGLIELRRQARNGVAGLGQPQGTSTVARGDRSMAVARTASRLWRLRRAHGTSWAKRRDDMELPVTFEQ